jgi:hypothetical protein
MAVNHSSGRIVVELDPKLKAALHAALASEGVSLKAWLTWCAAQYVEDRQQGRFDFVSTRRNGPEEGSQ